MTSSILNKKLIVDGKLDLLSNILVIDFDKVKLKDMIRVDSMTEMSLDLISYSMYGTEDYVDVLMKFNRLNNALELKSDMIIAVPDLDSFFENSRYINYMPVKLQKRKVLFEEKTTSQNKPSKTSIQTSKHYRKDSNGNIIF